MLKQSFDKTTIICSSNGRTAKADILQKNDKILKVALENTNMTITLHRTDLKKVYVGNQSGLEFTSTGETL